MDPEYRCCLFKPLVFIVEDDYIFKGGVMLSKINFDIISNLKYDFISLELIILERESTMEAKYLDNVNASETKGKGLEARSFHLSF